jgi:hypothetical protein
MKKIIAVYFIFMLIGPSAVPIIASESKANSNPPTVIINIDPYSVIYEGDIIDCDITGDPTVLYWTINNQSRHTTFYDDDPIVFDPEPTPLDTNYVNLTVYVENEAGKASDAVLVMIKRIYFGDIHWHTRISDGYNRINTMYGNALRDNYLDFAACSDHSELIDSCVFNVNRNVIRGSFIAIFSRIIDRRTDRAKTILHKILGYGEWQNTIKNKAKQYYYPGKFTTILGFEWSASSKTPGGSETSSNGHEDVGHINFYYRDVYPNAAKYSSYMKLNYDSIFEAMAKEYDDGHLNFGMPHHPQGYFHGASYSTNWSFLANNLSKPENRDKILRGVEVYSRWGTSIGQYYTPDFPWHWPYDNERFINKTNAWVENAMWEWSKEGFEGKKFAMMASCDTHQINRPGSASVNDCNHPATSGIVAAYAVHNTREEIWDAMDTCDMYATQLLKIRANVRFDGQMALGRWINCSSPLKIAITAQSTFPGLDRSSKRMRPHAYSADELDYPIQDIWIIKKDRTRGRPWCKVINHTSPNTDTVVVNFQDDDVQPNDFYWIAIRQKGQELKPGENEYMAFIGPIFIDNVVS